MLSDRRGLLTYTDPGADRPVLEVPTVQCVHCSGHFIEPRFGASLEDRATRVGRGWCQNCRGFVCGKGCEACVHWEQMLENIEAGRPADFKPVVAHVPFGLPE